MHVLVSMQITDTPCTSSPCRPAVIDSIKDAVNNPRSALQIARVRRNSHLIESSGRSHDELFDCDPVYLGRTIGVVNILERGADGVCSVPAGHLEELCAELVDECLAFLDSTAGLRGGGAAPSPPPASCLCSFPFVYDSRTYNSCTLHGDNTQHADTHVPYDDNLLSSLTACTSLFSLLLGDLSRSQLIAASSIITGHDEPWCATDVNPDQVRH